MNVLAIIDEELHALGIPYEFMRWTDSTVPVQYWIGEYSETPSIAEDGSEEITMMLTGTTRGTWFSLEDTKQKIKNHFPNPYGLRKSTGEDATAIFYETGFPIDTGEADLKRMQINLKIKIWRGK